MNARALVRRPGRRLAEGLITHIHRTDVDVDLALRQWQGYVDAMRSEGWETVEVPPADGVLHLKSGVTALPDGTIVGHEPLVDDSARWPSFLPVPEGAGAHVVLLDGSTVLMSTSAPATRTLFESRGLRVVAVDLSEFEKLEGCVTCLSVRLRG
jgi:N-dimethylarginine dimethylaminohydrolase